MRGLAWVAVFGAMAGWAVSAPGAARVVTASDCVLPRMNSAEP